MTKRRLVVPLDDDFLRDVDPEEQERRQQAVEAARIAADKLERELAEAEAKAKAASTS